MEVTLDILKMKKRECEAAAGTEGGGSAGLLCQGSGGSNDDSATMKEGRKEGMQLLLLLPLALWCVRCGLC